MFFHSGPTVRARLTALAIDATGMARPSTEATPWSHSGAGPATSCTGPIQTAPNSSDQKPTRASCRLASGWPEALGTT